MNKTLIKGVPPAERPPFDPKLVKMLLDDDAVFRSLDRDGQLQHMRKSPNYVLEQGGVWVHVGVFEHDRWVKAGKPPLGGRNS